MGGGGRGVVWVGGQRVSVLSNLCETNAQTENITL